MAPTPGIRLLNDQVLVEPIRVAERFENFDGLLWKPQIEARNRKTEFCWLGRVVLCGPGDKYKYAPGIRPDGTRRAIPHPAGGRYAMEVNVGDLVLYERRPWAEIRLEDKDYVVLIEEQHIVAYDEQIRALNDDERGDWQEAFAYADPDKVIGTDVSRERFSIADVVSIHGMSEGENDGDEWVICGELRDGRHFVLRANCDYTGWDCQAGGDAEVAATRGEIIQFGCTEADRFRMGLQFPGEQYRTAA
jgi:hypothetical protein